MGRMESALANAGYCVENAGYLFLMKNRRVIEATLRFLSKGDFNLN